MKYATVHLPDGNYPEKPETWILIDKREANILVEAVEEYSANHPRSELAKKMLSELDRIPFL